eukprot:11984743-Alexandrium_andersonii.AAC.1
MVQNAPLGSSRDELRGRFRGRAVQAPNAWSHFAWSGLGFAASSIWNFGPFPISANELFRA